MKELTTFIVKSIIGTEDFSVSTEEVDDRVTIYVVVPQALIGLLIGKEGKTIKNIRRILSILATKENKVVAINITEQV